MPRAVSPAFFRIARMFLGAASVLMLYAAFVVPALADPPARVGRLSAVEGTVSMRAGDQEEWSLAPLNVPVTSGNVFWVEPGGRAEIRVGPTALRLDGGTELRVVRLDDQVLRADVPQGTLDVTLNGMQPGESYAIGTPRGAVILGGPGTYHVDAGGADAPTRVAVLAATGAATVVAGNGSQLAVRGGESGEIGGDGSTITYATGPVQPTQFDRWALAHDEHDRAAAAEAARYVPPAMTGYEDLDSYGTWRAEPAYGTVWYPQAVPADWAPYRYGHWRWVDPWGWTWIDDAPWGFAPFHYGRWAYIGNRWGWVPGAAVARPVYAPALVVFVGDGPRWRGFDRDERGPCVGWFPLGPREIYRPAYAASPAYVRNVNITHVTNVGNATVNVTRVTYANRRFATIVSQGAFVGAKPAARAAVAVPAASLAAAPASSAPPVGRPAAGFARHANRPEGTGAEATAAVPHPPHVAAAAAALGVGAFAGAAAAHAAATIPPNPAGAARGPAWHGGPAQQQHERAPFPGTAPVVAPHPPSIAAVRAPVAPRSAAVPHPATPGSLGPATAAAAETWRQPPHRPENAPPHHPANAMPGALPHPATQAATAPMPAPLHSNEAPRPHQVEVVQQQRHAMPQPPAASQPRPQFQPPQPHPQAQVPHPRPPESQRHENGGGNGGGGSGKPRPPHGAGNG